MNEVIAPPGIAPPAANYAQGVLTTGPVRWLHTAGIVGGLPDGTVPATIGEQARQVWRNLAAILEEASMPVASIVSVTTYVVSGPDLDDRLAAVMAERDRFMDTHLAASTLITVPALARPHWLVEIGIVAAR